MRRYIRSSTAVCTVLLCSSCMLVSAKSSRLTVHVIDEQGQAISGATVRAFFSVDEGIGPDPKSRGHEGITRADGTYTVSDRCDSRIGVDVNKEGFYESRASDIPAFEVDGEGKWRRIDPRVDVVLVRAVEPIPMYARHIDWSVKVPTVGKPYGYDLIKADWVEPHGKGTQADVVFKLDRENSEGGHLFEATLAVTFPNPGDGLVPVPLEVPGKVRSALASPRIAPATGYISRITWHKWRRQGTTIESDSNKNQNYCMRLRSDLQDGKVVSALYGKLVGDVEMGILNTDTAVLSFTYYINPTPNSRNLEFDPKQNLFKNLDWNEEVRAP